MKELSWSRKRCDRRGEDLLAALSSLLHDTRHAVRSQYAERGHECRKHHAAHTPFDEVLQDVISRQTSRRKLQSVTGEQPVAKDERAVENEWHDRRNGDVTG